mgnify:CR=1 FL=1
MDTLGQILTKFDILTILTPFEKGAGVNTLNFLGKKFSLTSFQSILNFFFQKSGPNG